MAETESQFQEVLRNFLLSTVFKMSSNNETVRSKVRCSSITDLCVFLVHLGYEPLGSRQSSSSQ